MNLDRRTFSALLASTAAAPRSAFAQAASAKSAFYSGIEPELAHYEVDPNAATLTGRGPLA
jgi:hypothetical protein